MADFTVTPWEVTGNVDYDRLITRFGTQPLTPVLLQTLGKYAPLHPMFRRGFFFSHRDFDLVLKDHAAGKGFFLYTGRGPSGAMHIGHLTPLLITKWLQDTFHTNLYIEVTDDEKFLVKGKSWEEIAAQAEQDMLDIAALGFDPERTFIFRDSEYIKNVYPLMLKIAKKVNHTTTKAVFGFTDQSNIGITFYPAYQIVPTFFEKKRCLIPAAIDQDNYWRIQRDIAEDLGGLKAAAIHSKFLPPLTGPAGKMSSSQAETAVYLTDDETTVRKKVSKYAFSGGGATVEEHRKKGGNPDVDVAYQWLSIFLEPDDVRLKHIHDEYKAGRMLTGEIKQLLIDKLTAFLAAHQQAKARAGPALKKMRYTGGLAKKMWEMTFA